MTDSKRKHPYQSLPGILGAVGGWALSQYSGAALWIPGLASLVFFLLFLKTRIRPPQFAGAISLAAGHCSWFLVAGAVSGAWMKVVLDIVALTVAIAWLWWRPGIGSALFLFAVEVLSLAVNVIAITGVAIGSNEHRALTVHCVFRGLTIAALAVGMWQARRASPASDGRNTARAG